MFKVCITCNERVDDVIMVVIVQGLYSTGSAQASNKGVTERGR